MTTEIIAPRIVNLQEKKLIGKRLQMSLSNNKTAELWRNFMPLRSQIKNPLSSDLISMQVYSPSHFSDFKFENLFDKWACVEVVDFNEVPMDMETFILTGGLYAVFDYKGSSADTRIFQTIFGVWLPGSEYFLDDRPHFEVLGEKYKNNDPESEEEIWIPIKLRG